MKAYIHRFCIGIVSLLETKIKASNLGSLYQRVFGGWCFTSNTSYHDRGRVILAWKSGSFDVNVIKGTIQFIHWYVLPKSNLIGFYCTFVYECNERHMREELWQDLRKSKCTEPWVLCGDFN